MDEQVTRILRLKEVILITGLSRSTIYLYISNGFFPAPIKLGGRAVGWTDVAINRWLLERVQAGQGAD